MSYTKEIRQKLYQIQGGKSPLTGDSLDGYRLERHHLTELSEGGPNTIDNQVLIPIAEHLGCHLANKNKAEDEAKRLKEIDIVLCRIDELNEQEKEHLADVTQKLLGARTIFF